MKIVILVRLVSCKKSNAKADETEDEIQDKRADSCT